MMRQDELPPGTAPARVLLVDDNATNRRLTREMLRRQGITDVTEAEHGLRALELFRLSPYDLVFMDCSMPVMDGYEATRELRLHEQSQQLRRRPVIALTAKVMEGDRETCLAAGMDDYLAKPLQMTELASVLARWLGWRAPALTQAPASAAVDPDGVDTNRVSMMFKLLGARRHTFYSDYLRDTQAKLNLLCQPEGLEATAAERLIHSIKGSAGNVGAAALMALARELEERLMRGEATVLQLELARLEAVFQRFRRALETRLEADGG